MTPVTEQLGWALQRLAALAGRARHAAATGIALPSTATLEQIRAAAVGEAPPRSDADTFVGIGIGAGVVEGRAVVAGSLLALLERVRTEPGLLGPDTILVVPTLEPSWAVIFPRVGAVAAQLGGELSHGAILLREVGKPAVVNAAGVFEGLTDGARVRLDAAAGRVTRR